MSDFNGLLNTVTEGDCLEVMKDVPDGSVDMILADLPYGTTACKWDSIIPFEPLWEQYERIVKDRGVIVLTASQPFTSALVMSNPKLFRYEWVWDRIVKGHPLNAKKQPLRRHESVLVFYKRFGTYNPQMVEVPVEVAEDRLVRKGKKRYQPNMVGKVLTTTRDDYTIEDMMYEYPSTILEFNSKAGDCNHANRVHPTQKPVPLFEYLIRTYTNEGETVLDNVIGSGTTAVAAINTNRQFIGIEKESEYVEISKRRIDEALSKKEATG